MELITTKKMKIAEEIAISKYEIGSLLLMENAANSMFLILKNKFENLDQKKIAIFCGAGNNGGDGYTLARKLHIFGVKVTIYSSIELNKLKDDAKYNANICKKLKIEINEVSQDIILDKYNIIIDGLVGTGLTRKTEGIISKYIDIINKTKAYKVAIDVPTGLHSDLGIALDKAIYCDLTICFGRGKVGLFTQPGFKYSKEIIITSIDIPNDIYKKMEFSDFYYNRKNALRCIKNREPISSKGKYGRTLVIAGSKGMLGAYTLCVKASMASGVGYTDAIVPLSKIYEYNQVVSEAVCIGIEDNNKQYLLENSANEIVNRITKVDSIIIGPGLSNETSYNSIIKNILDNTNITMIIDAKAINDISKDLNIIKNRKQSIILTPHPGEMARLIGSTIEYVQNNRIKVAKDFSKEYGTIVLLKGHRSIATDGNKVFINSTGNAGMATAGSGDVLAGIIGAKVAISKNILETVAYCMYIHGYAGDIAKKKYGENGLIASRIIENLIEAERELYEEKTKSSMG